MFLPHAACVASSSQSLSTSSADAAKAACRAVSVLAHGNITNRNRLGASDACTHVPRALLAHLGNRAVAVWAIRAVADLAANNPNNQTKLGAHGACEGLVDVVRVLSGVPTAVSLTSTAAATGGVAVTAVAVGGGGGEGAAMVLGSGGGDAVNATGTRVDDEAIAKWTLWAIGNMVDTPSLSPLPSVGIDCTLLPWLW